MPNTDQRAEVVARLAAIQRERDALDREELALVARARGLGAQWTEIGAAVGMRRQHAYRKFAPLLNEQTTRTVQLRRP
jgi:hypothetical protein